MNWWMCTKSSWTPLILKKAPHSKRRTSTTTQQIGWSGLTTSSSQSLPWRDRKHHMGFAFWQENSWQLKKPDCQIMPDARCRVMSDNKCQLPNQMIWCWQSTSTWVMQNHIKLSCCWQLQRWRGSETQWAFSLVEPILEGESVPRIATKWLRRPWLHFRGELYQKMLVIFWWGGLGKLYAENLDHLSIPFWGIALMHPLWVSVGTQILTNMEPHVLSTSLRPDGEPIQVSWRDISLSCCPCWPDLLWFVFVVMLICFLPLNVCNNYLLSSDACFWSKDADSANEDGDDNEMCVIADDGLSWFACDSAWGKKQPWITVIISRCVLEKSPPCTCNSQHHLQLTSLCNWHHCLSCICCRWRRASQWFWTACMFAVYGFWNHFAAFKSLWIHVWVIDQSWSHDFLAQSLPIVKKLKCNPSCGLDNHGGKTCKTWVSWLNLQKPLKSLRWRICPSLRWIH